MTRTRTLILLVLLPTLAAAQPAPTLFPSRDVVARYQVDGEAAQLLPGGLPGPVTLSWDVATQRLRAEAQGRNQIAVLDLRAHTSEVFDTALRVALPMHMRLATMQALTLEGEHLQARGHDTVAGLACTVYAVEGRTPGTVCVTADGIPLRGVGTVEGRPGRFVALSVAYASTAPDQFTPPPGYITLGIGEGKGGLDLRSLGRSLLGPQPK